MAMKGLGKKLGIAFIILVVLIVISVTLVWKNLDSIVRRGVVEALTYILEVDVTLDRAHVSVQEGTVELEGLVIGNPEGFDTEQFFTADKIRVEADIASFRSEMPRIRLVSIQSPHVTVENGKGGSNLSQLIEMASRFEKEGGEGEAAGEKGSGSVTRKIRIDKILMEDVKAGIEAPLLKGKEIAFTVPRIELNDLGGEGNELTIAGAVSLVFNEIMQSVLKSGGNLIPKDLSQALSAPLEGFGDVIGGAGKSVEGVSEGLKSVGDGVMGMFKKKDDTDKTEKEE